jgi:hypothetical protein
MCLQDPFESECCLSRVACAQLLQVLAQLMGGVYLQAASIVCSVMLDMLTLWPLHITAACARLCVTAGWLSCLPHWVGAWPKTCSNSWQAVKQQMLVLGAAAAQSL